MDMCRFAYTTYEKTMIEIKNYVKGGIYAHQLNNFLVKLQTLDETVIEFSPPTSDKCTQGYHVKFVYEAIKVEDYDV